MKTVSGIQKRADDSDVDKAREYIYTVLFMLFIALFVAAMWWLIPAEKPRASLSVSLTDIGGLEDLVHSPLIHPAFDLSLRVDNYMSIKTCRENATVTVSYGGVVLGWGDIRDFCVDKSASTELKATMSHADVMLTDELRGSMASKLRAGELEVSVEMRMLFPAGYECYHCDSEILQLCRVKPGQGYSYCKCYV